MSMNVYLMNFNKRLNSTKKPSYIGSPLTCNLKTPTSYINPILIIENNNFPAMYNYAYIPDFLRYYYITDVIYVSANIVEVHCKVDVLACHRADIIASTFYIDRAIKVTPSDYPEWISDGEVIPTLKVVQSECTEGDLLNNLNLASSEMIVRSIGPSGSRLYAINMPTLQQAFSTFFALNGFNFQTVQEALNAIFLSIANPSQYITSVMWFPFDYSSSSNDIAEFGFAKTNVAVPLVSSIVDGTASITLPSRFYNDWRDYDPRFTSVSIFLPGVGDIQIDPKHLVNDALSVFYQTDVDTGAGHAVLMDDSAIIGTYAYQAGCRIPIGGLTGEGVLTSIPKMASGAASLLSSGNMEGILSGFSNAIVSELTPSISSVSASGNREFWIENPLIKVNVTRLGSTGDPGSTKGIPYMREVYMGDLSGFVKCSNAVIKTHHFTESEGAEVNQYLNSGFYLE